MCLRHSGIYRSILMNNLHTYIYKGLTQNEYSSGPHSHRQTHSCILTLHEIPKTYINFKNLEPEDEEFPELTDEMRLEHAAPKLKVRQEANVAATPISSAAATAYTQFA